MLNIWQIYYSERTRKNCYSEYSLYDNTDKLTEHFENSVIVELIEKGEHLKGEYFGVFSHDIGSDIVFREDGMAFNPHNLEKVVKANTEVDVFSFQKRRNQKNIVFQAENYHKGFLEIMKNVLSETGFLSELPRRLDKIILFNYWVARSEVYASYVEELLAPAMKVLEQIPEAYQDAKYKTVEAETKERFRRAFGKPWYPYHPFILERLPSIFMQERDYSFKHIF